MIENTDLPELPRRWLWTNIEKVTQYPQYGWTTSAEKSGNIKLLRTTDITSGKIDWRGVPYCKKTPDDIEKYILHDGDIVISRAGSVGYSHLIEKPERAVFASYLIRFKPLINPKYFSYFLKSPFYWQSISKRKLGIAVPNVNATKLKQIFFPLAPQNEQERIVEKIEELFTKLDASVEDLKSVKRKLGVYRKSFLNKLYNTKKTKKVASQEITDKIQDGSHFSPKKKYPEKKPNTFLYITAKNIRNNGMNLKKILYVEKDFFDSIYPRCNPQIGDVLLTKDGANTGMCCINTLNEPFALLSSVALIRGKENILSNKYLLYYLQSPEGFYNITGKMTGTAIKRIILKKIKEAEIPLVPIEEQKQIVQEIESRFSVIDKLEETVDNALTKQEHLRKSILKNAFEGKLVPQDPSDEPAEILLKNEKGKYEQMRLI